MTVGTQSLTHLSDLDAFIEEGKGNEKSLSFYVEGIHCAGCIKKIEKKLNDVNDLKSGRVNFSTNKLTLLWEGEGFNPNTAIAAVEGLGFGLIPAQNLAHTGPEAKEAKKLLVAMAVAGFGSANIMLLSFAVWAGYFSDMGEATRGLFHWISGLIAMPVVVFSGRPFFFSAWRALKGRSINMDVPISLAVIMATGLSLSETIQGGEYAYFDAAAMLLFFLLVGRYLDMKARSRARAAGDQFLALQSFQATLVEQGGALRVVSTNDVKPGALVLVRPGEKIPVDGKIEKGNSDLDTSLITGETVPQPVAQSSQVFAGTLNLTGVLYIRVKAVGSKTLLSEVTGLMERAEAVKNRYIRWADKAASIYAPLVHGLGLVTFLGWWLVGGMPWQEALTVSISVLIITCPCALGIAVPVVQVVAIGRLLKQGIIAKSGEGLEKLSTVGLAVFDKTGTITTGQLHLINKNDIDAKTLELASGLAASSKHPLARALRESLPDAPAMEGVKEVPGFGLELRKGNTLIRLGQGAWCGAKDAENVHPGPELWLSQGKKKPIHFRLQDTLKDDAKGVLDQLRNMGVRTILLSGDREASVRNTASEAGFEEWYAAQTPEKKLARLKGFKKKFGALAMVGDGLNDAPSLAMADASLSPTSAADISQTTADIVFQGDKLMPILESVKVARKTRKLVFQNFSLAVLYNLIAIPIAVMGYASPLVAAIAMSSSSIIVILNGLRGRR